MASRAPTRKPDPVFYRPEGYDPQESVGYLMKRILNGVVQEVDRELAPHDLTHAQLMPLMKLWKGEATTVAEIARECALDNGATTRLLDRLETKGLVRRIRSSEDRRVVNLELTEEGLAVVKKVPALLCSVQNVHLRGFTVEEWETLRSLLRRVLQNAMAIQAEREEQK